MKSNSTQSTEAPLKMHVLINAINDNAFVRGTDRYLLGLLVALAEIDLGVRYTLCHAPWQPHFRDAALPGNFARVELRPPRGRTARVLWHALVFPRIVARFQPDLVHLPNIIFSPVRGAAVVMTVHDLAHFHFPEKFGPLRGRLQRLLIRSAVRRPERLIAVSEYTRAEMARYLGRSPESVRVILEGPPAVQPTSREADAPPYFLYVGQIERSKNVEGLLRAFLDSEVLARAGVELYVAGMPGNAAPEVRRLIERAGDQGASIRLLGYVEEDHLARLYANCLAFVFPSLMEGFGLVLLEAMAYNAPVIAMRTSAVPEVVGDAALLLDPDDHYALRGALENVLRDETLRETLRLRGRKRVLDFSWDKAARETLAVYRELAE